LRDIRDSAKYFGDLQSKNAKYLDVLIQFKRARDYTDSARRRDEARARAKEALRNGSTR